MLLEILLALFAVNTVFVNGAYRYTYSDLKRERNIEMRIRYEEKNCTDKAWAHCDYYMRNELCVVYRRTLRDRCRKSCNLCGNLQTCAFSKYGCCWDMVTPAQGHGGEGCPRNCHNRLGLQKCSLLKLNGACISDKKRMDKMCKGVCLCQRRMAMAEPSCSWAQNGCCWDGATAADKYHLKCPICRDFLSKWVCRIFRFDCYEVVGIKGWQMRRFCPRTCGICRVYKKRTLEKFARDLDDEIAALEHRTRIIKYTTTKIGN